MTEQEQKAFEAWAEPILGDNPTWRESGECELARQAWCAALTAANAVSEPVGINGLTEAETSATMSVIGLSKPTVQPQAQGEQRYLSIERVSGFPEKLETGPQPVLYSDSINGCMVRRDDVWLALTSHLNPQATEPAWRPIESAPKDGTEILLANPDGSCAVGWFKFKGHTTGWTDGDTYNMTWPTHWMPLPAAPEAQ